MTLWHRVLTVLFLLKITTQPNKILISPASQSRTFQTSSLPSPWSRKRPVWPISSWAFCPSKKQRPFSKLLTKWLLANSTINLWLIWFRVELEPLRIWTWMKFWRIELSKSWGTARETIKTVIPTTTLIKGNPRTMCILRRHIWPFASVMILW